MGFWLRHIDLLLFGLVCVAIPVLTVSAWLRRGRLRWVISGLCAVEILCILYGFLVEPRWLEVTRHPVQLPGLGGSLRVVQLSDLHLDGDAGWQKEVLAAVRDADPDLILLTGDYLNDPARVSELRDFLVKLSGLVTPQRVFAVTGNFEMADQLDNVFSRAGISLLDGVVVTITRRGASLQLAGIGFHSHKMSEEYLVDLASQLAPSVPALLMHHTPDLAESPGIEAFDFVFSGHTHGGQVRLPLYGALITLSRFGKRYESGLYRLNPRTRLYVNRGMGTEPAPAPRVRFLCRPELAVFDFSGGS